MRKGLGLFALVALLSGVAASAYGSTVPFNFDPLSSGANSSQISTYMNGLVGAGASVTVTGAVADRTYNGDNHVVGPAKGGASLTLGTSDGASDGTTSSPNGTLHLNSSGSLYFDTFIRNISGTPSIIMTFSGLTISSVSFDYEIFPDGTCPSLASCGGAGDPNLPDMQFFAGNSTNTASDSLIFHYYGVAPGTGTSTPGTSLSTTSGWTSYIHSPNSGSSGTELAPQLLGTYSTALPGVTTLIFQDWPATVAIDNLVIGTTPPVPEPGTMFLLGTGLVVLLLSRKKRLI